jgi:hypothetical protein
MQKAEQAETTGALSQSTLLTMVASYIRWSSGGGVLGAEQAETTGASSQATLFCTMAEY